MPKLKSKAEGMIPSNTWDTFVEIGIKALNSGDARFFLREAMSSITSKLPNVVMVKHGQEPWTSNTHRDDNDGILAPYKSKIELRIFARDITRARQEVAKVIKLWELNHSKYKIYRIVRLNKDWSG